MKNKELPFPCKRLVLQVAPMNAQKWQSCLQVGDVKQCPQLAPLSSSGRSLLVSMGGWGEGKNKVRGG